MLKIFSFCFVFFAALSGYSKITFENGIPIIDIGDRKYQLDKAKVTEKEEKRFFGKRASREVKALISNLPSKAHKLDIIPARNQGDRGSCNVFPAVGLIEYFVGNKPDYSEQCLLYYSSDEDGGNHKQRLIYARDNGLYEEKDCPYILPEDHFNDWFLADDKKKNQYAIESRDIIPDLSKAKKVYPKFKIVSRNFDDYSISENINHIRENLLDNKAVAVAVYIVNKEGWKSGEIKAIPTIQEIKDSCKKKKDTKTKSVLEECGTHAVLLTGFDDDKAEFYFRNSWGQKWGLNKDFLPESDRSKRIGYGLISYEHFARFGLNNIITLE